MKKSTLIVLLLSLGMSVMAQKNEISLHYGIGTSIVIIEDFSDVLSEIISIGIYRVDNESSYGCLGIEYQHDLGKIFQLGGVAVYQTLTKDLLDGSNTKSGKVDDTFFSIIPELKVFYIKNPGFGLFSGIGAGVTFRTEKVSPVNASSWAESTNSETIFAFQLDVVGVDFGTKLFGSAALGFGVKGILNAGIGYRF